MKGGSLASDRVMSFVNNGGASKINSDAVVSPRYDLSKVVQTYQTTGGARRIRRSRSRRVSRKLRRTRSRRTRNRRTRSRRTRSRRVSRGGNRKSKRKSTKKNKKKSSKKSSRKRRRRRKAKKSSMKGGGSDWVNVLYSRGPVSQPSNPDKFRMFAPMSDYVSNETLFKEGHKSPMFGGRRRHSKSRRGRK